MPGTQSCGVLDVRRFDDAGLRCLRSCHVVFTNAQLAVLGELVAFQVVRPLDLEPVHDGLATVARGDAQGPARRYGPLDDRAHGREHAAQEELQVVRTLDLHQRVVLLHLEAGLLLPRLAQYVGHDCLVVRDPHAERYGDRLAPAMVAGRVVAHRPVLDLLPGRVDERGRADGDQRQRGRQPHGDGRPRAANTKTHRVRVSGV